MSRSEQNVVREMCQAFLHDAVPEYIRDTAYYILSEGGVQKINIQEGETWEAQGVIQGEDLQVYTPSLTFSITDRSTRHQCNCSESFTSTCRHVAALALRLLEELRKEQGDAEEVTPPAKDWKQSFRSFYLVWVRHICILFQNVDLLFILIFSVQLFQLWESSGFRVFGQPVWQVRDSGKIPLSTNRGGLAVICTGKFSECFRGREGSSPQV